MRLSSSEEARQEERRMSSPASRSPTTPKRVAFTVDHGDAGDWAVLHDIKGVDDSADPRTLHFVQQSLLEAARTKKNLFDMDGGATKTPVETAESTADFFSRTSSTASYKEYMKISRASSSDRARALIEGPLAPQSKAVLRGARDVLHALAATAEHSNRSPDVSLPARLRAIKRTKLARLSQGRSQVPAASPDRRSPPPHQQSVYHPLPFTPAHVPAMHSPQKDQLGVAYGTIFGRDSMLRHWRHGMLAADDPEMLREESLQSSIGGMTPKTSDTTPKPPSEVWSVSADGSEKLLSTSALDVKTLAEWLNDSRPIDQSGAYSLLLLAKDLIRRLLADSVHVWNSTEDQLKHEVAAVNRTLQEVRAELKDTLDDKTKIENAMHKDLVDAEKRVATAQRLCLQAELRTEKFERDYHATRSLLVEERDKKAVLEKEIKDVKQKLENAVWNGGQVRDLMASLKSQPLRIRRQVAVTLMEQEAAVGTMYLFCKEMPQYLQDSAQHDKAISMAMAMHLVESSDDPMQFLRDLTAQRQRVLGRRGLFSVDTGMKDNIVQKHRGCQTDPMPALQAAEAKASNSAVSRAKRRTFLEASAQKPKAEISASELELLDENDKSNTPPASGIPAEHDGGSQVEVIQHTRPKTKDSKSSSPTGSSHGQRLRTQVSTPKAKGEMLPGAIQKWIPQIIEAKLIQDEVDVRGRGVLSMPDFISEYFPRKYGLPALAKKAMAELMNGLKKFASTHKRIRLFATCCCIDSEDTEFANAFTQFLLLCISRCLPIDTVSETLSKRECEIEADTVNRVLEWLFTGEYEPAHPDFRQQVIKMCKVSKKFKNQPAIDIDQFLCRVMAVSAIPSISTSCAFVCGSLTISAAVTGVLRNQTCRASCWIS